MQDSFIEANSSFEVILQWSNKVQNEKFERDDFERDDLVNPSLVHFHHKIEQQYRDLPWPSEVKRISVMTEAPGGRGDVAAAAKLINILQQECPSLEFDWAVVSGSADPKDFQQFIDPSKVNIASPFDGTKTSNLLLVGPAKCGWSTSYIKNKFGLNLDGPRFAFLEAGTEPDPIFTQVALKVARDNRDPDKKEETYTKVHKYLFPSKCESQYEGICMGLTLGSGLLLDQSRLETELSRNYCCPKPILNIKDQSLKEDILSTLNSSEETSLPNFEQHSLNSGYAHRPTSWGKFIDCVAIQEREKHVTIVINQEGEFDRFDTNKFSREILSEERLAFLKQQGYGKIQLKGKENKALVLQEATDSSQRDLTAIIRPSFRPEDMKQLQLASERLLATGMNTPAESWASKCKLYIYEDVANGGVTDKFLDQQIAIANEINPKLGRFLQITGNNSKLLPTESTKEISQLLLDPELNQSTLKFCEHLSSNYQFKDAVLSSLKRVIWHHYIPELKQIEVNVIDDEFKEKTLEYLQNYDFKKTAVKIKNLPILKNSIHNKVAAYRHSIELLS